MFWFLMAAMVAGSIHAQQEKRKAAIADLQQRLARAKTPKRARQLKERTQALTGGDDMSAKKTLTKTQQKKAFQMLKKLVDAPEVRELVEDIQIGKSMTHGGVTTSLTLMLTKKGLLEYTAHQSDWGQYRGWESYPPSKVKPTLEMVNTYGLTESGLEDVLEDLQA